MESQKYHRCIADSMSFSGQQAKWIITASLFLILTFYCQDSNSKPLLKEKHLINLSDPHYITGGTYVFDIDPNGYDQNSRRVISSYLPNGTLVFPVRLTGNDWPKGVNRRKFGTYVTQHGQVVVIRKKEVSRDTFADNYGDLSILFHNDTFMCEKLEELDCTEDDGLDIARALVAGKFEKKDGLQLSFYSPASKLERVGFISKARFEKLEALGIISDVSKTWPRYVLIEKREFKRLSKPCGPQRTIEDVETFLAGLETEVGGDILKFLSLAFNLSFSYKNEIKDILKIGEANEAIRRFEYKLIEPDETGAFDFKKSFSIYSTVTYHCVGETLDSQEYYAKTITLSDPLGRYFKRKTLKRSDFYSEEISDTDAEFIWNNNRSVPFFFSINHRNQYEEIIEKIIELTTADVAISNIILSLFNGTCESKNETRTKCRRILD